MLYLGVCIYVCLLQLYINWPNWVACRYAQDDVRALDIGQHDHVFLHKPLTCTLLPSMKKHFQDWRIFSILTLVIILASSCVLLQLACCYPVPANACTTLTGRSYTRASSGGTSWQSRPCWLNAFCAAIPTETSASWCWPSCAIYACTQ